MGLLFPRQMVKSSWRPNFQSTGMIGGTKAVCRRRYNPYGGYLPAGASTIRLHSVQESTEFVEGDAEAALATAEA